MAIDDPIEAYDQQYMQDEQTLPSELASEFAKVGGELALPGGALAVEILLKVKDVLFNPVTTDERVKALWELLKNQFQHVEETKASHEDVQRAIQQIFVYDRYERDDKKRERYVKLIGSALRSEEQIHDVATFIQIIEQLNERDVIVLKVLNRVMNREGDLKPQQNPGPGAIMKLHPSTLISRGPELNAQVAMALGQKTETNNYSREEGYMICTRLQGFGLAHEVDATARELPLAQYAFRLSAQGISLLKLLGEDVPNFEWYIKDY